MTATVDTALYPYSQSTVEEVSKAVWVRSVVEDGSTEDWAQDAWEDMGGSEPAQERAELEVDVGNLLRVAPEHSSFEALVDYVVTELG
jgi:hypothetical protein